MRALLRPLAFAAALLPFSGCPSEKTPAPRACCDQPTIPAGVSPFQVVADDVTGPSDGQKVQMRVGLKQAVKRDALYPVLHTLYRHAMTRTSFEPIHFVADVYATEAEASAGGDGKVLARITRQQSDIGPKCDNRVSYDLVEQVARAFAASTGHGDEEDLNDSCKLNSKKKVERFDDAFKNRPSYKLDAARQAVEVTYPFLESGKDEFRKDLKYGSAMGYWIEFTTSLLNKVADLKEISFVGIIEGEPGLRITMTRQQFDAGFSRLQETIAAHAAVTFQTLGMHAATDKRAEKEQDTFKTKTYKKALSALPKNQVTITAKMK